MPTLSLRQRVKAAVGLFTGNLSPEVMSMLAGILPGGRGEPAVRGTRQLLQSYSENPWARGGFGRIANSAAAVTWRLYGTRARGGGKYFRDWRCQRGSPIERTKAMKARQAKGELVEITEHPMLDMLYSPNTYLVGLSNRMLLNLHLDLVGEAFFMKERNALGVPVGLWPIPPHWITATPTPATRTYAVSFRGWTGEIPETEILSFVQPNPENPYGRGSGIARSLADELDTDEAASKHVRNFFFRGARPDLLVFGEGLTKGDTEKLEDRWTARQNAWNAQGFWSTFKPFFLNRKVEVKEIGQNFKNMELTDLRKNQRDIVLEVLGLPPELMGILESSNRATIDAADLIMARYVLVPRLEFQREVLQERLAPEYDDRLIVGYDSPVAEDKEFQLKAAEAAPEIPSVDEWRALLDLAPAEDGTGELHIVQPGVYAVPSLDQLPDGPAAPIAPPLPATPPPADGPSADEPAKALRRARIRRGVAGRIIRRGLTLTTAQRTALWRSFDQRAVDLEPEYEAAAIAQFEAERAGVADLFAAYAHSLAAFGAQKDAFEDEALDAVVRRLGERYGEDGPYYRQWVSRYRTLVSSTVELAGGELAAAMGISFNLQNPRVQDAIATRVDRLAGSTTSTTYEQVRALVADGRAAGQGMRELAGRVDAEVFAGQAPQRATTIARTETIGALNEGEYLTAVDGGVMQSKEWLTQGDGRVRPSHAALDGSRIPIAQAFANGLQHPGDQAGPADEVIQCRCTLLFYDEPAP